VFVYQLDYQLSTVRCLLLEYWSDGPKGLFDISKPLFSILQHSSPTYWDPIQDLEGSNYNPRNMQCISVGNPAMVGSPPLILSKSEYFETASKG